MLKMRQRAQLRDSRPSLPRLHQWPNQGSNLSLVSKSSKKLQAVGGWQKGSQAQCKLSIISLSIVDWPFLNDQMWILEKPSTLFNNN